jgi:hypothetical protein
LNAIGMLLLLHGYIGWRLLPDLPLDTVGRLLGWLCLAASSTLIPAGMMARRIKRQPLGDRVAWAGLLTMGLFSSLLVLTLLRDLLLLCVAALQVFFPSAAPAHLRPWSAAAVPLLAL